MNKVLAALLTLFVSTLTPPTLSSAFLLSHIFLMMFLFTLQASNHSVQESTWDRLSYLILVLLASQAFTGVVRHESFTRTGR